MTELLIATKNRNKAREFAQALNDDNLQIATLADDSGLMVDYLHGQPGVRSARYAEDHNDAANNAKLLAELAGVPLAQRQAQFLTTIVYQDPATKQEIEVVGQLSGQILTVPRGNNGFGYDPLFYVPSLHQTLAQLSTEQKNQISHRGQAIKKFVTAYRKL